MALGLIGQKRGMTRIFADSGESVPVTVVEVTPNRITRVKTVATDGYAGSVIDHTRRDSASCASARRTHG